MAKIDLIDNGWVDLVFQGRNQAYGAYQLRKGTSKRNLMAILVMLAAAVLIAAAIGINAVIEANTQKVTISADIELSKLAKKKEPKVERKAPIKIEQQKVIEKVKSSVKFVAPVIKKDEEVAPEDELKSQDELAKTNTAIGTFDVKGNDEAEGEVLKAKEVIAQEAAEAEQVFDVVEVMPQFPGGPQALFEYLSKNIKYPVVAEENGVQGRVIVTFVVERDGSITDVQVVKSVDPSLDREAMRVVKSMPNWIPGKQNGAAVRVKYTVPVTFRLQ